MITNPLSDPFEELVHIDVYPHALLDESMETKHNFQKIKVFSATAKSCLLQIAVRRYIVTEVWFAKIRDFRQAPKVKMGDLKNKRPWNPWTMYDLSPHEVRAIKERAKMRDAMKADWQKKVTSPYRGAHDGGYIVSALGLFHFQQTQKPSSTYQSIK